MLLVLPLLLLQLLPPQGLGPLLVGQLEPQEVPPQRRLPGQVENGAAGRKRDGSGATPGGVVATLGSPWRRRAKHGLSEPPSIPLLTSAKKQGPGN